MIFYAPNFGTKRHFTKIVQLNGMIDDTYHIPLIISQMTCAFLFGDIITWNLSNDDCYLNLSRKNSLEVVTWKKIENHVIIFSWNYMVTIVTWIFHGGITIVILNWHSRLSHEILVETDKWLVPFENYYNKIVA